MQYSLYLLIFIFCATSCSSPKTPVIEKRCLVNFDSLMLIIDSSQVEIYEFSSYDSVEVSDTSVKSGHEELGGQGSVFHFDSTGKLGLYAFMHKWPYSGFEILYDSTGTRKRLQENEVVQWIFYTTKDPTVKFTFLLCALDRNYGDIKIESGKFKKEDITLLESAYSKIICATVSINSTDLDKTNKIYISGRWQDKCSGLEKSFVDSTVAF